MSNQAVRNFADTEQTQRVALADMIERRIVEIELRWLELVRVGIESGNNSVTQTDLRNAIADYLNRLAEALRQESISNEVRGATVWAEVAREHAITRVRLGFDIDQLVYEFVLLRRVLVEFARSEGL